MKIGWERTDPVITPDYSTATTMLKSFLNGRQILNIEPLGGGLSNSNLKISLSDEKEYVLRIYNHGGKKGHIEKEVLHLVKNILPVPSVLYHDLTLSQFEYPFVVLNYLSGFQLSEVFLIGDEADLSHAADEVGRYLASMHTIRFSAPGFFDEQLHVQKFDLSGSDSYLSILDDILSGAAVTKNLGTELVSDLRQLAIDHAELLDNIGNQSSLVHSDFNPMNILIQRKEKGIELTGILDWEFAFSNTPLIDIGNILRYENVQQSTFMPPFIHSYLLHGGELPEKWLQKAKLLDIIALCDLVNKEECGEIRIRDVKQLLHRTLDEWDLFAKF